jgi:hypothetical protein
VNIGTLSRGFQVLRRTDRRAKEELLKAALQAGDSADWPYVYKTVLQYQCYGRPDAKLA